MNTTILDSNLSLHYRRLFNCIGDGSAVPIVNSSWSVQEGNSIRRAPENSKI